MLTRCRPLLGTFVEITVPADHAGAVDAAFAVMAHVHGRMSFHAEASDLARLRAAVPGQAVAVDPETATVLRAARELYQASGGLFDVTTGRQLVRDGFLPRMGIASVRCYNGSGADIEVSDDDRVVLHRPVLIDLGGIAKGHAVDRAVELLIAQGVPEGLVNAGGDLRMFGEREWPVYLRDADDVVRYMIPARDCAIASSANLRNRRTVRGHERSPHVGAGRQPVLADGRVTVIAPSCIIADAMTKVAMVDVALAERLLAERGGQVLPMPAMAEAA